MACGTLLPSELMADIRFPSVIIVTGEWAPVKCAALSCGIERGWRWFIMIFLRSARFFQQFLKYVCPAFSVPLSACTAQAGGSRSDVQRTPRLNTLEGNLVQLSRGAKDRCLRSEVGDLRSKDRGQMTSSPGFVKW